MCVCVCVGCTQENKGFAGIRPLQQTNGSRKLAVAPSDTWSALNLTGAQGGVGGWKGRCFRVIIFKSLVRGRPRVFGRRFIRCCCAGRLQESDKGWRKLHGCIGMPSSVCVRVCVDSSFVCLRWLPNPDMLLVIMQQQIQSLSLWIWAWWEQRLEAKLVSFSQQHKLQKIRMRISWRKKL